MRWLPSRRELLVALVVWSLLMLYLLLWPQPFPKNRIWFFAGEDKVVHAALFFVWSGLLMAQLLLRHDPSVGFSLLLTILVSILLGAGTELVQGFMPRRSSDRMDFVADLVGILLGCFTAYFSRKELRRAVKKLEK